MYYSTLKFIQSLVILNFGYYKWWSCKCLCPVFFCSLNKCTRISSISCSLFCFVDSSLQCWRSGPCICSQASSLIASHPLIFSLKILSFLFIMLKIESYIRQACTLPLNFTPALSLIFSDFSMWLILLLRRLSPSRSSSVKLLVCLGSLAILILGYALLHYFSCLATKSLLLCRLLREFSLLTEVINSISTRT